MLQIKYESLVIRYLRWFPLAHTLLKLKAVKLKKKKKWKSCQTNDSFSITKPFMSLFNSMVTFISRDFYLFDEQYICTNTK